MNEIKNSLAYAGCILRFEINENGYVKVDIYEYDNTKEQFRNIIDKPILLSMTMKSSQCLIVGSCLIEKGLGVLLQLITSNSSILMFIQIQSRIWSCQILYTLATPSFTYGSLKCLAINSFVTLFRNDEQKSNGFYIINGNEQKGQKIIEFISCSLLTYIYCYLKDNQYWLMGTEMDLNTERKSIKVYYACSISLICFNTNQLIPFSLIDNIESIHIVNHKLQLKTYSIIGDVILSSKDHRIVSCHNGIISSEISLNYLINSIEYYFTIENEQIFLFQNQDHSSIEIFQYTHNCTLIPYTNAREIAELILFDDFLQIGWKQILFLKTNLNLNSFLLTDFSQIHVCQEEFNAEYHTIEKDLSIEMEDNEMKTSMILAQDILRKKIINADFIVNEGYIQCKQIENDIRKISNRNHVEDLSIQLPSDYLIRKSTLKIQLMDTNWFIYQTNLFIYVKIRNLTDTLLSSVNLFVFDKSSTKTKKVFQLKTASQTTINEQMIFNLNPHSSSIFVLTTSIELDKDIDFELFLLINEQNQLFRLASLIITIDDLINSNKNKVLQLQTLDNHSINNLTSQQAFIYLNTLFRLSINIESSSKCHLIEHFHQLLSILNFKQIYNLSNVFMRYNPGDIFEHAVIHLANEDEFIVDDLVVHFYAKNSTETIFLIKYILTKLDFQSFSLINSIDSLSEKENERILNRIQIELRSYIEIFKQIPTVMRKLGPTVKSESYRLFTTENFQLFSNEIRLTDLLLASLNIDSDNIKH